MTLYRRLPLEGMCNARDLGGYATPNGITKFGVFVRSEIPAVLSDADVKFIYEYDIKTDIDLRSKSEQEKVPDRLKKINYIKYLSIPMYDVSAAHCSSVGYEGTDGCFWAEHYIRMVETQKNWFRDVITQLSDLQNCTLFHCATGKDRTGLISMAILGLCDVSSEDIIADYSISEVYLHSMIKNSNNDPFFSTAPGNMRLLLEYIANKYGDIKQYLYSCGVTESSADKIIKQFVEH